ncbi:MAG: hypothetical protein OER43_00625 [Gammaproteobacteria bacterium]|nr:hypothetical protein [Gammaproteobacteria bacterium]MDH3411126.1 hypothetical protein [Gammaproteobacteria bacterium]
MQLNPIQRHLQSIYEVDVPHDVDDFLVTDRALLEYLGDNTRRADEKLLVVQNGEEVELALYLDPEIMARLREDDPTRSLHYGNIADFCTVLEGVSHFLYLTWNAEYERGVSLFELEMQAEVDKYVSTAMLFGSQGDGKVPERLYAWLFEDPVFDESLDEESLKRYRDANYYAGRYCSKIESHYFRERRPGSLMNELRRFYRLPQHHKIKRIKSAA